MGGGRRAPFGAGEREKALEAVRAVTQPKVCTSYHQATIILFKSDQPLSLLDKARFNHTQAIISCKFWNTF